VGGDDLILCAALALVDGGFVARIMPDPTNLVFHNGGRSRTPFGLRKGVRGVVYYKRALQDPEGVGGVVVCLEAPGRETEAPNPSSFGGLEIGVSYGRGTEHMGWALMLEGPRTRCTNLFHGLTSGELTDFFSLERRMPTLFSWACLTYSWCDPCVPLFVSSSFVPFVRVRVVWSSVRVLLCLDRKGGGLWSQWGPPESSQRSGWVDHPMPCVSVQLFSRIRDVGTPAAIAHGGCPRPLVGPAGHAQI
jgi:hypothetical protein